MARRSGGNEGFRIDASEFKALNDRLKDADKAIARKMRKTLKAAADDAVKAVRDAAMEPPPAKVSTRSRLGRKRPVSTRVRSRGMRKALARATTASLTNSKSSAGLRVITSQRRMPKGMGPMVKAWNTGGRFRHPVFADAVNDLRDSRTRGFRALSAARKSQGRKGPGSWRWAEQNGTAYFTTATRGTADDLRRDLARAMDKVADELAN